MTIKMNLFAGLTTIGFALSATPVIACDSTCSGGKDTMAAQSNSSEMHRVGYNNAGSEGELNIVQTAKNAGSFNTLLAAAKAADLATALAGEGPFTVFAPTDEAFAKLPAGTVENLLKPENKAQLASILKYHVVPSSVAAKAVVDMSGAVTLNGQQVDFTVENGTVMVDSAKVVKTDIMCSNGIIHVIDAVILPQSDNIVEVAQSAGQFGTLLTAAKAAGLVETLTGDGPLTLLAPTDEAFAALPAGTVQDLLKPENREKLATILKFHVIPGRVYAAQALENREARTVIGQRVKFEEKYGAVKVNGAKVLSADIDASNGVIHVIDRVILPE